MAATWITAFLVFGALFGVATFRIRHLLSEGPSTAPAGETEGAGAWVLWLCIATTLWPVLALSGLYAWWRQMARGGRPRTPS